MPPLEATQQTAEERRALRGQYRRLYTETLAGKENLVNGGARELREMLGKADRLHAQVARPREHAVDAEVLAQLSEYGLGLIQRGRAVNQGRTPADLARALRFLFAPRVAATGAGAAGGGGCDWAALGAAAAPLHRTAPGVGCMLGPLAAEAKARRVGARAPKRPLEELVRPDELDECGNVRGSSRGGSNGDAGAPAAAAKKDKAEKQETDRNYESMWRRLKARGFGAAGRVRLAELVVNHQSFAQTVENVFTLSFLVRDQRVRLIADDGGDGLAVQPVGDAEKQQEQAAGRARARQFMMSLTMAQWRAMCHLVDPAAAVMPHRGGGGGGGGGAAAEQGEEEEELEDAAAAAGGSGGRRGPKARRTVEAC